MFYLGVCTISLHSTSEEDGTRKVEIHSLGCNSGCNFKKNYATSPSPNSILKFVALTSGKIVFLTLVKFTIPYL